MAKRRTGAWRDEVASTLVAEQARVVAADGPCLVLDDGRPELFDALEEAEVEARAWYRRAFGGRPATAWPPAGPFGTVALRLPKAKDELEMLTHAAAAALRPGGRFLVYGAKDEGIGSAPRRIDPVFGDVAPLATGGRCRVLSATRPLVVAELKGSLDAWRAEVALPLPELRDPWVSFPGVFAHGRLDAGTKLLLSSMPRVTHGARVLDFGCGSGVVGAVLRARQHDLKVDFLDVDTVALEAVAENVPDTRTIVSDGLGGVGETRYDAIVANPPYHRRTARTMDVIGRLVRDAPHHLTSRGSLTMVVQKGLPVRSLLEDRFGDLETVAEDASYLVLMAWAPRPEDRSAPTGRPSVKLPVYSKGTARGTPQ